MRVATLLFAAVLLAACSAEPSPDQLKSTLTQHPEILYDAIRAHPQEFVTLLDSAARATSRARQASSEQAEEGLSLLDEALSALDRLRPHD